MPDSTTPITDRSPTLRDSRDHPPYRPRRECHHPCWCARCLLRAAEKGLCRVRWSEEILAEAERHLPEFVHVAGDGTEEVARLKREKAKSLAATMQRAFPDALITDYQQHIPAMRNSENDRHVAAAAYAVGADIVTYNTKHFPRAALRPFGLRAHHPDHLLTQLFAADPDAVDAIIRDMERELTRPTRTVAQLLEGLERANVQVFAATLRGRLGIGP
jgi:hypothetical protein